MVVTAGSTAEKLRSGYIPICKGLLRSQDKVGLLRVHFNVISSEFIGVYLGCAFRVQSSHS